MYALPYCYSILFFIVLRILKRTLKFTKNVIVTNKGITIYYVIFERKFLRYKYHRNFLYTYRQLLFKFFIPWIMFSLKHLSEIAENLKLYSKHFRICFCLLALVVSYREETTIWVYRIYYEFLYLLPLFCLCVFFR